MRIGIIVDQMNPNFTAAIDMLRARGAQVEPIRPENQPLALSTVRIQHDLYIIKSGAPLGLSLAGTLHALGARTLNPYPTVMLLQDKMIVTRLLQQAGVPTPETVVTTTPKSGAALLPAGPLILKPYQGHRGRGIRIVASVDELDAIPTDGPILVQRYHPSDGCYHKVYRVGAELLGVRRVFPARDEDRTGEPFTLSSELRDIGMRIGQALGIDLYSFDVVFSAGKPYVVDVNKFGSYLGVPDAARRLADYIYAAAARVR